jgi:hypothetical protein
MDAERVGAIEALLGEAEAAHAVYETTELGGVYDQAWPQWYAAYLVEHDIEDLVGHEVSAVGLASFLASSYAAFEREDPKPIESWARYIAGRIATEL